MTARRGNSRSSLGRRRRTGDPMAAYDRLPAELRRWLAQAALPWSARSALRVWRRALRACDGDTGAAQRHLHRVERARLAGDIRRVWGADHPAAQEPPEARRRSAGDPLQPPHHRY